MPSKDFNDDTKCLSHPSYLTDRRLDHTSHTAVQMQPYQNLVLHLAPSFCFRKQMKHISTLKTFRDYSLFMETYRYLLKKNAASTVPRLLDGTESGEALPGFSSKYSIVQEVGVTVRMLKP